MKKVLSFLICFLWLSLVSPVFADNEFSTSYDITYSVGADAVTSVTQKVTLKNQTDNYYASNFILQIGSTDLTNISATDGSNQLETKVEQKGTKTIITVILSQQVVGIGKTQSFELFFRTRDFAENVGKVWQVTLPRAPTSGSIEKYNVTLKVPLAFGDPTSISPKPRSYRQVIDVLNFSFIKEDLKDSGISANFGTLQTYDYSLVYSLNNSSVLPANASIPLPPNTRYQDSVVDQISPAPINTTIDGDGNILAWFRVNPKTDLKVEVKGKAELRVQPKSKIVPKLTDKEKAEYTKADNYWDVDNPLIKTKLSEIFSDKDPKTTADKALLIYRFVVNGLEYDTSRLSGGGLSRMGALTALNNPTSAVCMEFTDLFITLARSAGIPARELDGYAFTQNTKLRPTVFYSADGQAKEFLHAWPEYFDEDKGWVMVDPTWENTSGGVDYFNKFDLNHLILSIRGFSSEQPITSDDVNVTVSSDNITLSPKAEFDLQINEKIWTGFPVRGKVIVSNKGNYSLEIKSLQIDASKINILSDKSLNIGTIPPYGVREYQINLRAPKLFESFEDTIVLTAGDKIFSKKIKVEPISTYYGLPVLYIGLGLLIAGIYAGTLAWHVYAGRR